MNAFASVAGVVSSAATCIALIFAGFEFRRSRTQDRRKRQVEIDGVAVSWRRLYGPIPPLSKVQSGSELPRTLHDAQGRAAWEYEFTAYNPGDLPISDVRVEIHFPIPVARLRRGHLEDSTMIIVLESTPVLAGHGSRTWHRRLVMDYEKAQGALHEIKALISFIEPEEAHKRHTNYWPKQLWENRSTANSAATVREGVQATLAPGHASDRRL
jgi:hypothetical protein